MNNTLQYKIREIKKEEYGILDEFLYEAIFIPEGVEKPEKSIIEHPDLKVYIEDFGKKDDCCLVAEVENKIIGAVWTRIMNDYGHIDEKTPSLSISIYERYRNLGIGTNLLIEIKKLLKGRGYKAVSLSVQKENYAFKIYEKLKFDIVGENEEEYIMLCKL